LGLARRTARSTAYDIADIAAAAYDAGCRALVTTDTAFITDLVPVEQLR
jgi:hypothetical protein